MNNSKPTSPPIPEKGILLEEEEGLTVKRHTLKPESQQSKIDLSSNDSAFVQPDLSDLSGLDSKPLSSSSTPLPTREEVPVDLRKDSKFQFVLKNLFKNNSGLVILSIAEFFNSIMIVSTKVLQTNPQRADEEKIKPLQVLLVRMSITYAFTLLYMWYYKIDNAPFGEKSIRKFLVMRGTMGFLGVFGLYYSLNYLSITDAILIRFLAPTITVFLAFFILNEIFSIKELIGSMLSFIGVLLIIRPKCIFGRFSGQEEISIDSVGTTIERRDEQEVIINKIITPHQRFVAVIIALIGVFGGANVYIIIRFIGKRAHAVLNVAYFSLLTTIVSFFGIIFLPNQKFQIPKDKKEWLLMINLGICGFIYQLMLTIGIQRERAAKGSLISYLQILFAIFWDVCLWNEWPNLFSWFGMIIIMSSTMWVVRAKEDRKKQQVEGVEENNNNFELNYFDIDDEDFEIDDNDRRLEEDEVI